MPNIRWLLAAITAAHRFVYLASGGLIGGRILWMRFLLLIHVGRKTGRTRTTPLLYIEDGERWIFAASNAGAERHPGWWYNLTSRPEAQIRIGRELVDVVWREASPEECERLWLRLNEVYSHYADYRVRSKRVVPILILERTAVAANAPQATAYGALAI